MTPPRLHGLPQFLRLVSTFPEPDAVAHAIQGQLFAPYGARTCSIWMVVGDDLVSVADAGHTPEEVERYGVLPGALDLIMWRAVRNGQPMITDGLDRVDSNFASIDEEYWQRTLRRVDAASVVRAPVMHAGRPVGALGLLLQQPWTDAPTAAALLDTVTSVIGTWMTCPDAGTRQAAEATRARSGNLTLSFTDRQLRILRLVEKDMPTPQIATTLRISESSVKQDLQQIMRALNTRSRSVAAQRARELGLLSWG